MSGNPLNDLQQLLREFQARLADPTSPIYSRDVTSRLRFADASVYAVSAGPSRPPRNQHSGTSGPAAGTIVGIAVGCAGALALVALVAVGIRRRQSRGAYLRWSCLSSLA